MAKAKITKARKPTTIPRRPRRGFWAVVRTLIGWALLIGVVIPVVLVLVYRFVPPPGTILMVERAIQGKGWNYHWTPIRKISPALVQAAVASEDARFCDHHGFDFDAIQKAMEHNERHPNRIRGASTISQQTAKNVFLWPGRDWVRKGFEAYFTVLIEVGWGKKRIMEMYLNVAEMGPGIYGADAAAHAYFKTDAQHLSPAQAARLVAVLPNPIKYKAQAPGRYVKSRAAHIGAAAGTVREAGLADCVVD